MLESFLTEKKDFPVRILVPNKSMGAESDLLLAHCHGPHGDRKLNFGARKINEGKILEAAYGLR